MTVGEWLLHAKAGLEGVSGCENPALEARVLLKHALNQSHAFLLTHPEFSFDSKTADDLLRKRRSGVPLPYVVGHREFFGRSFMVDERVLIPRPETEILVELVLSHAEPRAALWDVGTGSGCIAITLALERPDCIITACDVSADALDVARANAQSLGASVTFELGDGRDVARVATFLVSNPPYVANGDALGPGVREHEPHVALFDGGDGLEFYRAFAQRCPGPYAAVEIGAGQAPQVTEVFEAAGWALKEFRHDLAGIPRAFLFVR